MKYLILVFFIITSTCSTAQNTFQNSKKHRIGYVFSIGDTRKFLDLGTPIAYSITSHQINYFYKWREKGKTSWEFMVAPQINHAKYKDFEDNRDWIELKEQGVNFGVSYNYAITKSTKTYLLLSIGPHYISELIPYRAAKGLTFSDNATVGITQKISSNFSFDLRYGIRHISNAGLKKPNIGINTMMLSTGLYVQL